MLKLCLCWTVLGLAAATLPHGPQIFDEFKANSPAWPLGLLHYPPAPAPEMVKDRQLDSSAHMDFGAITLLLQDEHPGLQVIYRVINKNLTDLYSVVFFFYGNLDYMLRPLDSIRKEVQDDDDVLTVEELMLERKTTTYNEKRD
ncbi:hypothetical protein BDW68DRAFT_192286 [Aspergillus falconensis]